MTSVLLSTHFVVQIRPAFVIRNRCLMCHTAKCVHQMLMSGSLLRRNLTIWVPWIEKSHFNVENERQSKYNGILTELMWSSAVRMLDLAWNFGHVYYSYDFRRNTVNVSHPALCCCSIIFWSDLSVNGNSQLANHKQHSSSDWSLLLLNYNLLSGILKSRQWITLFQYSDMTVQAATFARLWLLLSDFMKMDQPVQRTNCSRNENVPGWLTRL